MAHKKATLQDLKKSYERIFYKASDGQFYRLADYYPFHFDVKARPDCICLDTAGEMPDCDFAIFKVKDGKLLREQDEGGKFKTVSSSLIIR